MQDKRYSKCLQSHGQLPAPGATAAAKAGTFITFDVPGSTCLFRFPFCTRPTGINPAGVITGIYADASGGGHGFLRTSDGTITNIDPPGSGGSFTNDINPAGVITGNYCDATACHNFLRSQSGAFTKFDPSGSIITQPNGINPAGAITGYYQDVNFVAHGFLRAPDGTFTTFDAPGSTASGGTFPLRINPVGVITGQSCDDTTCHGFLRTADGAFTTIDPPGSTYTNPTAINPAGEITGDYFDTNSVDHGFLRAPDGTFTTFDVPGSGATDPSGINPAGAITGLENLHGFLRARDGTFTIFDVPGSKFTWRVAGINRRGRSLDRT